MRGREEWRGGCEGEVRGGEGCEGEVTEVEILQTIH